MNLKLASLLLTASLTLVSTTGSAQPQAPVASADVAAPALRTAPAVESEVSVLKAALDAARGKRVADARAAQSNLSDPVARRLVDWALLDVMGDRLGVLEVERGVESLRDWPREEGRKAALARTRTLVLPEGPRPYSAIQGGAAASSESWTQRRLRMNEALRIGDPRAAYAAVAAHALTPGSGDYAEAEAFAGWLALNKLNNPYAADRHFANLDAAVRTPVSKARAAYWRGRTYEQVGDVARARAFYEAGARHNTTFYGLLAAERAGHKELALVADPVPTPQERAGVEGQEVVRAMRLLKSAGEKSLVRVFALHLGDQVQTRADLVALMDVVEGLGEKEVTLLTYRRAAQRGLILHERGYPVASPPVVEAGAESPLVLAIVRQESQFDPTVRSSADARGMMQLRPPTGREMAQKVGLAWDDSRLWDPEYNMRLGSRYLGHLTNYFGGSYVLAMAGYNAGPSRPKQWVEFCGDPRSPGADPLDFIECIPFSETRNYVMNAMANLQVYRARTNSGRAELTLSSELRRGGVLRTATAD